MMFKNSRNNIKRSERPLLLETFSILTLTVAITKILKVLKDTFVVTNPQIGVQLIPFLKTWALIPLSYLFIKFLTTVSLRYSYRKTYCLITLSFLGFLSLYVFLLRPFEAWLCPHAFFETLKTPHIMKGFLLMLEYWPVTLFYVSCDLWPIVMLSMLFWVYISTLITLEQGKRFFPIFSLDPSGILIGPLMAATLYLAAGSWNGQIRLLMGVVVFLGLLQTALFYRLCRRTKKEPSLSPKKAKVGWRELLEAARHPLLGSLAVAVFLFEFTDNLFDVFWKGILGEYIHEPERFSSYLANVITFSGVFITFVALGLSYRLLKQKSWFQVALIPPALLGILSLCFFICYFFPEFASRVGRPWGMHGLGVVVFAGAAQTCLMAVVKQTFFDNTRDLAIQVCSDEERGMARTFSDAFASRVGKSTSSLAQQSFLIQGAALGVAAPYIALLIGASIPIWIGAIAIIGFHFTKRAREEAAS